MKRLGVVLLALMAVGIVGGAGWLQLGGHEAILAMGPSAVEHHVTLWEPLTSDKYNPAEKIALLANVVIALAGLGYALMLVGQVKNADQGHARRCRRSPRPSAKGPMPTSTGSSAWWAC